jgi:protein ImuB
VKRVCSIWLPNLAIERWAKSAASPPDSPVVLTVEGAHGLIIHAVTQAAAERGARAGARLTDARALDPALIAVPADPAGDIAFVERLARWAGQWSPLVEVDGDGLRLDVTGAAHLFGGEQGLAEDVQRCFARIGLTVRVAIAPTAAGAWALSHFGHHFSIVTPAKAGAPLICGIEKEQRDSRFRGNDELVVLKPLPVAALRLDADTVRTLERLGLKTIGALFDMPRVALARRFRGAEDVVDALDRALGRKPEPLTAAPMNPPPRDSLRMEEPATHPEAGPQALERLIPGLVRQLQERHLGARRLSLHGFRVDGSVATATVSTAIASREPKHLQRLLADKAAALDPEFGFDAFALQADWTEDLDAAQESLVEEPSGEREVARLVDRLTVKLGPAAVRRPQPEESHLPERASGWVMAISSVRAQRSNPEKNGCTQRREGNKGVSPSSLRLRDLRVKNLVCRALSGLAMTAIRPQRLLDRPEAIDVIYATPEGMPRRFMWRRAVHDIARVEGPERIAPEWWRQPSSARLRDYYRVEDASGRRYWIYREGLIGDGRGGAPNWFIHGLFG